MGGYQSTCELLVTFVLGLERNGRFGRDDDRETDGKVAETWCKSFDCFQSKIHDLRMFI
jgi:hypothetical protein